MAGLDPNDAVWYGAPYNSRQHAILVVTSVFITLATLAVVGRFVARRLKEVSPGADDWTITLALVCTWAMYTLGVIAVRQGVGEHVDKLPPVNVVAILRNLYIYNLFYVITPPLVKMSLLLLYRRIFVQRTFHIAIWTVFGIISIWLIVMLFTSIFNCTPPSGYWDKTTNPKCFNFQSYAVGYAVVNVVSDVVVWLLPIPSIWRLQLKRSQKILLTGLFTLGIFFWACTLTRLFEALLALNDPDITFAIVNAYIWSVIEPSVGVLCACLPILKPVLDLVIPKRFLSRLGSRTRSSSYNQQTSKESNGNGNSARRWSKKPEQGNSYSELDDTLHSFDPRGADTMALAERTNSSQSTAPPNRDSIRVKKEFNVKAEPRIGSK